MAFISVGANFDQSLGSGPYILYLHSMLYHRHGLLLPPDGQNPTYAQIYIYDPDDALRYRM